jgi:hypothetical protein
MDEQQAGARAFSVRLAEWSRDQAALRSIRRDVFVVEQNVPESLEWDGIDGACRHAIVEDSRAAPSAAGVCSPTATSVGWRSCGNGGAGVSAARCLSR